MKIIPSCFTNLFSLRRIGPALLLALFGGVAATQAQDYSVYVNLVTNTPNLVGYWRFDSNFLANSYVNGYTGALNGSATIGGAGSGSPLADDPANQGLLLPNGGNSYLSTDLTGGATNQLTLMVWANMSENTSDTATIISQSQSGNNDDILVNANGTLSYYLGSGNGDVTSPSALPLNSWHFIVGTGVNGGETCLYIDGQLVASNATSGIHSLSPNALYVGESGVFSNRYFYGAVDEAAMFSRALAPSEVATLYMTSGQESVGTATSIGLTLPASVGVAGTAPASVNATFSSGSNFNVTYASSYSSSASNVLTVTSYGVVTGLAPGTAIVTATYNSLTSTQSVTVQAPVGITLTLPSPVNLGNTAQASVMANFSTASNVDVTSASSFASGNSNVLTVSSSGLAYALGLGTAVVTATYESMTSTQSVTVSPALATLMNEYSFASNVNDSIGLQNGVLVGGAGAVVTNGSVVFNGTQTAYAALPSGLLAGLTGFTIESWYTPYSSALNYDRIWACGDGGSTVNLQGGNHTDELCVTASWGSSPGAIVYVTGFPGWYYTPCYDYALPTINTKHQVVVTYNGPTQTATLYIDGALANVGSSYNDANSAAAYACSFFSSGCTNFFLGSDIATGQNAGLNGSISEFRIYNGALSASQVHANYTNQTGAAGVHSIGTLQSLSITVPSIISVGTLPASVVGGYVGGGVPSANVTAAATYASGNTNILTVAPNGYITALTPGTTTLAASYGGMSITNTITVAALPLHRFSLATNVSDTGATPTPTNATLEGGAVISGGAVVLNGTSAWVSLPSLLDNGFTAGTFEFWLTWAGNSSSTWQHIFDFGANGAAPGSQGTAQYTDLTLTLPGATGNFALYDIDDTWSTYGIGKTNLEISISPLSSNVLHHVVWTYDGATSALFVDGAAAAAESPMGFPYHFNGATNCWLGQSMLTGGNYFAGSISEFRLYDVALTPQQVALDAVSGPESIASRPGALQSLNLSVAASMSAGNQANATTTANWVNVSNVNVTLFSTYASSAPNVATVNAQGVVSALSPGQTTLTATFEGLTATQMVTVVPNPAQLAHRYSFWNNTTNDSIGTASGALQGDATVSGGFLNLDGTANSYMTLPAGMIGTNYFALSIEMWANVQGTSAGDVISSFGNPAGDWVRLATHTGSTPGFSFIGFYNGAETQGAFSGPVSGNVHLVAVWNPLLGVMEFYVNGYPANGNNISTFLSAISGANDVTNVIGANIDGVNYPTPCTIQEYRIYNGALTLDQIRTSIAAGPTNAPLNSSNQISAGTLTNVTVTTHPNFIVGTMQDPVVLASSAAVKNINLTTVTNVTFTSSNTSILMVTTNNQVQAVGVGTTTLTATYLGVSGHVTVTTMAAPPLLLTHDYSFVSDASDSIGGETGMLMGQATASSGLNLALENNGAYGDYLTLPRDLTGGYPVMTIETWVTLGTLPGDFCRIWSIGSWTYGGGGDLSGMVLSPYYPAGAGPTYYPGIAGDQLDVIVNPEVQSATYGYDALELPADSLGSSIALQNAGLVQIVVVLDPMNEHICAVYYNGQLAGIAEFTHPLTAVQVESFLVGKSAHVNDSFLIGTINEMRVFYGAMTAGQALANFNAGLTTVAVNTGAAQITDPPQAQTVVVGAPVTFTVGATGSPPLSYQWILGANPILGATAATYTIPQASVSSAGSYSVQVSNAVSSPVVSTPVQLTVDASVALTNALLLHITFDDSTYADVSGNGNNGVAGGSPVLVPGIIGAGAVHVNTAVETSTYNYVTVPNSTSFSYAGDFSVSFWQRHTGFPNPLPMVGTATNSAGNLGWVLTDDVGLLEGALLDVSSDELIFAPAGGSPFINDGNWHHTAMVMNRELGLVSFYVDGSQVASASTVSLGDVLVGDVTSGQALTIGQDPTGTFAADGEYDIDDLAVWSRALGANEVQAVHTLGESGQSITGTVPVTMTVQQTTNGCVINFAAGVLKSAPTLLGPWTTVPGATAPSYTYVPSEATNQFFRVETSGGATLQ